LRDRRESLVKLASAVAFLAIATVAVLIVVSQSGSSGGDSGHIVSVPEVERELQGIPQHGMVLGHPDAKVALVEFGDLQCTSCKAASEGILPDVIAGPVRSGEAKLDYRAFTIIGAESTPAAAAAIAAGEQGRGWDFVEIFYRNQGEEDSGYVSDGFLTALARHAGVPDIDRWNRERESEAVLREVEAQTAEAKRLGFTGTPSFAVEGPATEGLEPLEPTESATDLESAIANAR